MQELRSYLRANRRVLRLYAFAFLVSLANWAVLGIEITPDSYSYIDPAIGMASTGVYGERLSSGDWHPTAFRTPGTSCLIAISYLLLRNEHLAIFITGAFFALLAPLIALFAYQLGSLWSRLAGYIAYGLMLLHANLHFNAVSIMSDLPFAAMFSAANMVGVRWLLSSSPKYRQSVYLGALIGLSALIRPPGLYWLAGICLLILARRNLPYKARFYHAIVVTGCAMLLVGPWMVRNKLVQNTFSLETIKGLALLWSIGNRISLSPTDSGEIKTAKTFIIMNPNERMLHYYYRGYDYTLRNQQLISDTLGEIAITYIKDHPGTFMRLWRTHFLNIFRTQLHYDEWLRLLELSPRYNQFADSLEKYRPRIRTNVYHANLELKRISSLVLYLLLPGLVLIVWRYPLVGSLQVWNIAIVAGLTALVQGYDRFRLPLDPLISACAAICLVSIALGIRFGAEKMAELWSKSRR